MARIFMDGFESGVISVFANSSSTIINSSKIGRTGNYCVYIPAIHYLSLALSPSVSEIYIAFKVNGENWSMDDYLVSFYNSTTRIGSVIMDTDVSNLRLAQGGTAIPSSNGTVLFSEGSSGSTWYLIEIRYLPHISSGTFQVKVNGIMDIDKTGVQTAPSTVNITSLVFGGGAGLAFFVDDIIIDDANWIGSSSIQGLAVTGAGTTTQFDPSTGSNYACIDEIPPSDTDYISTNTPNEIDTYACGDLTGTINSVKAVQVQARCMQEGSPAVPKIQLVTRPSSTDRVSASKNVQTFQPSSVANIWELNPDDSAAWESADVNGMEIGVKAVAS